MRFNKAEFQKAFVVVSRVTNGRSKVVLGCVRVQAIGGAATLSGSDGEIFMQKTIVGVEGELDVLLPTDKMSPILSEIDGEEVEITESGKDVLVQCGSSKFTLSTMSPEEFFVPKEILGGHLSVGAVGLATALNATMFAVDTASTRYQLGGVAIEHGGGVLNCVATDGRRLAVHEIASDGMLDNMAILPQRACTAVCAGLAGHVGEQAKITVDLNSMRVECNGTVIVANLIEGRYPNWRMVEPDASKLKSVAMVTQEFHRAIRQAAIFTDKESRGVTLKLADGSLLVSKEAETGKSSVALPIAYEGEGLSLVVDSKFVTDFLKVVEAAKDSSVELRFKDPASPIQLVSGENYRYVVMPMSKNE